MAKLLPLYSIASSADVLSTTFDIDAGKAITPIFQARPKMELPVILMGNPALQIGTWSAGNHTVIDISKTLQARPWNIWLRKQRCIIPANCFYGEGDKNTSLVRLLDHRLFGIAGLFDIVNGKIGFTMLTTSSPPILKTQAEQMPVLCTPENSKHWLNSNLGVAELMGIADSSGGHWFDFYPVSEKIKSNQEQNKSLLNPLRASYQQNLETLNKLKADPFKGERGRRHK